MADVLPGTDDGGAPTPPGAPHTYRLLTGPDDATFCARVSEALASGYRLHGSPALTFDGERVIAAQAVVLVVAPGAQVRNA
ncbi:MAG: DUF1737 domain-containing protein [Actinomycetales bacterium]|nr:DUF1737 domain-containing protein [Actinomycetales bacterium]